MNPDRYCTECGNGLTFNDKFCPACGAMVKNADDFGEEFGEGTVVSYSSAPAERSRTLNIVMILCLSWGILALISGLSLVLNCSATADAFIESMESTSYEDGNMWEYLLDNGIDKAAVEALYMGLGVMLVVSGLFAALSGFFSYRQERYKLSLVFLIISTAFAIFGLITFIAGIVVTLKLTKCKDEFYS